MNDEYSSLREEMLRKIDLHNKLIMFAITTTVAILAYAFSEKNAFIFLVPLCVIIPTSLRVIYYRSAMVKLAAYILVFIEDGNADLNWETRNHKMGRRSKNNGFINKLLKVNINYDCLILSVVCYILYIVNYINCDTDYNVWVIFNIIWPILLVVIEILVSIKGNGMYKKRQYWIDEWTKIKMSELKK